MIQFQLDKIFKHCYNQPIFGKHIYKNRNFYKYRFYFNYII